MGNYQNIKTLKPADIENRKAYLIGGGVGSLSAAAFLIMDGHMDGKNITILEKSGIIGGSLDGGGNAEDGFIIRGGREMEEHFECAWDLFARIPSTIDPERSVLDEFRELNIWDPNVAACRVIRNCGDDAHMDTLGLDKASIKAVRKMLLVTEEELGAKTIKEYFNPSFFETNMWCFWRSMFAFEDWHSAVEMKRYFERFIHLMPGMSKLKGILFSKYNQYESFILPLKKWLISKDVNFVYNAQVESLDIDIIGDRKTVTTIRLNGSGTNETIPVDKKDLVFVTLGSMTENSTLGSMDKAPVLNRDEGASWKL
ncbi:MAG: oleate hydratase, partial [Eubacteriales bacterium]